MNRKLKNDGRILPGEGNGLDIPPAGLLLCGYPGVLPATPESCLVLEGVMGGSSGEKDWLSVPSSSTKNMILKN